MYKHFLYITVCLICLTTIAYSQGRVINQQKADDDFNEALQLYNSGQINSALLRFERVIDNYSLTSKTTASYFFKIKMIVNNQIKLFHYSLNISQQVNSLMKSEFFLLNPAWITLNITKLLRKQLSL